MLGQLYNVFMMLVAVGVVIILAYFTTIIIAQKSKSLTKNTSIKVLERSNIGLQVSITVVQINAKVYILANQGKELVTIDTIDAEEWYKSRQHNLNIQSKEGQQMPKSMKELLSQFKRLK